MVVMLYSLQNLFCWVVEKVMIQFLHRRIRHDFPEGLIPKKVENMLENFLRYSHRKHKEKGGKPIETEGVCPKPHPFPLSCLSFSCSVDLKISQGHECVNEL